MSDTWGGSWGACWGDTWGQDLIFQRSGARRRDMDLERLLADDEALLLMVSMFIASGALD